MTPARQMLLEFDPKETRLGQGKALADGLSVVFQRGHHLWLANDESLSLERLTLTDSGAAQHRSFPLADFLDLPVHPEGDPDHWEEADLEGLAHADGHLWLVGSHGLKRKNPKPGEGADKAHKQLAKVGQDGNRYLLARIPLVEEGPEPLLTRRHGDSFAARLAGDDQGNALTAALAGDEHLAPFLVIPGKDNGFDIEGLAVAGQRLFLGLRGPVLRGWAVILELAPEALPPDRLELAPLAKHDRPYLKHFLHLGGLGVRDLCLQGDDLLILAGPTMDLDGPVRVLRWPKGALAHQAGQFVPAEELQRVLDIPFGQGDDHAEGMTLFSREGDRSPALLVVHDAAAVSRKKGGHAVLADIFPIHGVPKG